MTREEAKRRLREMGTPQEAEEKMTSGDIEIEAPKEEPITDLSKLSREETKNFLNAVSSVGETPYSQGRTRAENEGKFINDVKDRKVLTDYYNAYIEDFNRALENNDQVTAYTDKILADRIAQKLGRTSTPYTAFQDFGSEITTNVKGFVADVAEKAVQTKIGLVDSLDPNVLYNVAKHDSGTLDDTLDNYVWGKNDWEKLEKLHTQYPNDEIITNLYETVKKQGYKGDKQYFEDVAAYVNDLANKQNFKTWQQEHTLDEQQARQNLDIREELSYNDFGKFLLDAAGVVSYMLPSIGLGAGVGATTGTLGTANAIQGAASIGSMSVAAAGNATTNALQQGYGWKQSNTYGNIVGALEGLSELIGGEFVNSLLFGGSVTTPTGKVLQSFITKNNITSPAVKFALSAAAQVNAEGLEEVFTEFFDPILRDVILKEKVDYSTLGSDLVKAYTSSILPTLILGGLGAVSVNRSVDAYTSYVESEIMTNTQLTNEQKGKIIEELRQASKDAKLGITANYEKISKQINNKLEKAAPDDARVRMIRQLIGSNDTLTGQEKQNVFNKYIDEKGLQYNPYYGTTQELLDSNKPADVTYNDQTQVEIDEGVFMGSAPNITDIETVTTTNKAKANVQSLLTSLAKLLGKDQVVLAKIATNDGSTVMGLTNNQVGNVFVNADLDVKDMLAAGFHELGHTIEEKYPNVFKYFKNTLEKVAGTKLNEVLAAYNNVIGKYDTNTFTEEQKNFLIGELLGDHVGEWMSKLENTKSIEKSTRTLVDNLKSVVNKVSNVVTGKEIQNQDVSAYNLNLSSYLDTDLLEDETLNKMLLNIFEGKKVDQVKELTEKTKEIVKETKEVTKKTEPKEETSKKETPKKPEPKKDNSVNARIERRYAEMKDTAKTPAILRMIAEETGLTYNPLVPVSQRGDNARIQDILTDLRDDGKITETGTRYSIIGPKATRNVFNKQGFESFVDSYNEALKYKKQGYSNEEIRETTGWFQDREGNWKFEISDAALKLKPSFKLKEGATYKLSDVLYHPFWFKLYPELKNVNVKVRDYGGSFLGATTRDGKTIEINSSISNNIGVKKAFLHEIQHAIQKIEGTSGGSTMFLGGLRYLNRLGEIEAADVVERYKKEMKGKLDDSAPLSSKKNPLHPLLNSYLKGTLNVGSENFKKYLAIMDGIYSFVRGDTDVAKYTKEYKKKNTSSEVSNKGSGIQLGNARGRAGQQTDVTNKKQNQTKLSTRKNSEQGSFSMPEDKNEKRRLAGKDKLGREYAKLSPARLQGIIHYSAVEDAQEWHKNYGSLYIVRMSPQEYLDITATPKVLAQREADTDPLDEKRLRYGENDLDASGGIRPANDIYLTIDMKTGEIDGQEGYHRIIALRDAGVKSVDVVLWPWESTINKDNLQNIKEMVVTGMNGKKAILRDIDAVTYNNIDYLKKKYLNEDVEEKTIRFSQRKTDSNGRTLTNAQIEFFKDSKIRDENGNLLVMYHGTNNEFTIFDIKKAGINYSGYSSLGKGFYFTPSKKLAENWSNGGKNNRVVEVYLNLKNPFFMGTGSNEISIKKLEEIIVNDFEKTKGKKLVISNYEKTHGESLLNILRNDLGYNANEITGILKECGFDGISKIIEGDYEWGEVVAFYPNQIKLVDNTNPTENPDTRFSKRKGEYDRDKVINNQRTEIAKTNKQVEKWKGKAKKTAELEKQLKQDNKSYTRAVKLKGAKIERLQESVENREKKIARIKATDKVMENTYKNRIRELMRESDLMLKTGRNTEYKMKGQLEREGKKYNSLSQLALDLKYELQLDRKAQADGISFGREYKDLFIGLRRTGDSIEQAYATTKGIYEESQRLNKSIDNSMKILNELRKGKIYNKLPAELKAKIDAYDKFWTKSRQMSDLTLAKRILTSETIKEHIGKVAISKAVQNKITDFDGKYSTSLAEAFNGSIALAEQFEKGLEQLSKEIKAFQAENFTKNAAKELTKEREAIKDSVLTELGKQSKSKVRNFIKNYTNKTIGRNLMTFKTETQALMGGNINTPLMILEKNLQNGEIRKKQAIVNAYSLLNEFLTKSGGINRAMGVEKWKASMEKALSRSSDWVNTGISIKGRELRLPRSMMMSLAMHLLNDQNMSHISGAITNVTTDDNGKTEITFKNGEGIRVPNESLYKRGNINDAYDTGRTVKLTYSQVQEIVSQLTEEEKQFVEATKKVFEYTTGLINEVSNKLFGYDIATVENYFPIHTWRKGTPIDALHNVKLNADGKVNAYDYLASAGWLQDRVTSFAPIYLENIAEVLDRSINNVANYYGYAEALRNNNILLNESFDEPVEYGDGKETQTLREAIGDLSSSYIKDYDKLTRFIVGAETLKDGKFRGLMAMNTLTFNIGTWLTQPMSFFNTLKYFSTKDFLRGINPINNHIKLDNMIRQYYEDLGIDTSNINDYQLARSFISMATPNLDYRALGYKLPEVKQLYNKRLADKIGAHGIEAFDNVAVTAVARMEAWVLSQEEGLEFGSEEYFERLGSELTQILVETQPEFSHINRANMFRSTNPITRMLSLFGTPANQMMNNFMQSSMEVFYEAREGKVSKEAMSTLAKSMSGIIVSSVLVGLIRALRDQIRNDDDEIEFTDRWIAQSVIAMLGPTLILDDLAQMIMSHKEFGGISSYDFNTPETTFVNGLSNLVEKTIQLTDGEVSPARKTKDIIRALGVVTPIDTKSLVRTFEALMKVLAPDVYKAYALQTNATVYKQWLKHSDTDMATFYKAYEATRTDNLTKNYGYHKADKENNIKSNLKEAREAALKDVLDSQAQVDEYMEVLFGYKK